MQGPHHSVYTSTMCNLLSDASWICLCGGYSPHLAHIAASPARPSAPTMQHTHPHPSMSSPHAHVYSWWADIGSSPRGRRKWGQTARTLLEHYSPPHRQLAPHASGPDPAAPPLFADRWSRSKGPSRLYRRVPRPPSPTNRSRAAPRTRTHPPEPTETTDVKGSDRGRHHRATRAPNKMVGMPMLVHVVVPSCVHVTFLPRSTSDMSR